MAFATPVLERPTNNTTDDYEEQLTPQDLLHNQNINSIYKQLINPETMSIGEIYAHNEAVANRVAEENTRYTAPAAEPVVTAAPVVQNVSAPAAENKTQAAKSPIADSYIFRSDSFVNRRVNEDIRSEASAQTEDEEDNEDLRPTPTTIQYKTAGVKTSREEGAIVNAGAEHKFSFSARDKVVIGVVVAIIVALFVLIIVNSAIISNLNSELGTLQTSLSAAKANYNDMQGQVADYQEYLEETVKNLAQNMGMIKN